jgi:hypothetical protein
VEKRDVVGCHHPPAHVATTELARVGGCLSFQDGAVEDLEEADLRPSDGFLILSPDSTICSFLIKEQASDFSPLLFSQK